MERHATRPREVRKPFGHTAGVDLGIGDGEFFSLLGPSGSGETTLLRLIAGFEQPDEGRIELAGRDVTDLALRARGAHRLPGLRPVSAHDGGAERRLRAQGARGGPRRTGAPHRGGARRGAARGPRAAAPRAAVRRSAQHVALARALVGRPRVLLLDEPLGVRDGPSAARGGSGCSPSSVTPRSASSWSSTTSPPGCAVPPPPRRRPPWTSGRTPSAPSWTSPIRSCARRCRRAHCSRSPSPSTRSWSPRSPRGRACRPCPCGSTTT